MDFVQFINQFFTPQVVNIHDFSALSQNFLLSFFVKCSFSFAFMCTSSLESKLTHIQHKVLMWDIVEVTTDFNSVGLKPDLA